MIYEHMEQALHTAQFTTQSLCEASKGATATEYLLMMPLIRAAANLENNVKALCLAGRIAGAYKCGSRYVIPWPVRIIPLPEK